MLQAPSPTNYPRPLTPGLLPAILRSRRMLLFLDYDGTISEITPRFKEARPLPQAREHIAALTRFPDRIRVAIVSGREIDEVQRLLGLSRGLLFCGIHGLEVMEPNGQRWLISDLGQCVPELAQVRQWLQANLPDDAGFAVEDKGASVVLHYRAAEPTLAARICQDFERFIAAQCPHLSARSGKQVVEALPRNASKGYAVRFVASNVGAGYQAIYFGDDLTDEDAFYALRSDGISVLVSDRPRPSWAAYRVDSVEEVVRELSELASIVLSQAHLSSK